MKKEDIFSKETIYVHYGSLSFDIKRFEYVQNCNCLSKPINGGLWASPENAEEGWQKINGLRPQDCVSFKFRLSDSARMLILNNKNVIERLPRISSKIEKFPIIFDFEKLSKDYDVICYKYSSEMNSILPCWDCDCILVMNPSIINELKYSSI